MSFVDDQILKMIEMVIIDRDVYDDDYDVLCKIKILLKINDLAEIQQGIKGEKK